MADENVAGLVAEQPDAPDEVILEFARHHACCLKGLDDGQVGDRQQLAQRCAWPGLTRPNADKENWTLRCTNQAGGLRDSSRRRRPERGYR